MRRPGIDLEDHIGDARQGVAVEGDLVGQALIEDDSQGVEVGPTIDALVANLFRRHVEGGAGDPSRPGDRHGGELRDPEIGDLGQAVSIEQDVGRLDVPMDEPFAMSGIESDRHLLDAGHGPRDGKRPASSDQILERRTIHPLHGDEGEAGLGIGVGIKHHDDAGMFQLPGSAGLEDEALLQFQLFAGIDLEQRQKYLEGHLPLNIGIESQIDMAHRPAPKLREDPVTTDLLGDSAECGHLFVPALASTSL